MIDNLSRFPHLTDVHILHPAGMRDIVIRQMYRSIGHHFNMLSNVSTDVNIEPLVYCSNVPTMLGAAGASAGRIDQTAATKRYAEIEQQLHDLANETEGNEPVIEAAAIETALEVVQRLRRSELAPPAISWLSEEAVVMLWAVGATKYALTVTDGAVGYVVQRNASIVTQKHSLDKESLEILQFR